MQETWECVVIGGGSAGLSAALVLGRARRQTLVVDAGEQSNLPAAGVGGFLTNDGRPPQELYAAGRAELTAYPSVEVRTGDAVRSARRTLGGFELELRDGRSLVSRRLLLAPGMEYRPPEVPGLAEHWGSSVFHCPFCHGWEMRGRPLGVLGGPQSAARALLLRAWSESVTLLTDGQVELDSEDARRLAAAGVAVEERSVACLKGRRDGLDAVVFEDGSERALDGLLVGVSLHQRSSLAAELGVSLVASPLSEELIAVDATAQTSVPGVYAAGDVAVPMPSVANAVASGSAAAALVVHELMSQAGSWHE